ncbi:MAG: radical SAM protein [Clostridia bacterium]|nr:radical SAM protein [Clostridia bacterium]
MFPVMKMKCNICPRQCDADRKEKKGYCRMPQEFSLARAGLHFWEEPPISGKNGSGTVFFSGCNLGCVYCQNYEISHGNVCKIVSEERLLEIFSELQEKGAHNINLVNPTHYAVRLADLLVKYQKKLPVVYNSSGYDCTETLKKLEGIVDIYLPDLKYISSEKAQKYSMAKNYFDFASKALLEMKRQCPENIYDSDGIMQKGMIVRHLILPKNTNQSIEILKWIAENLGSDTAISLMAQYTPYGKIEDYPELQRRITQREYDKVLTAALDLGFTNIFTQEPTSATTEFIPNFDLTGV